MQRHEHRTFRPMTTAAEALQRLKDGNRRFVEPVRNHEAALGASLRIQLTQEQKPMDIIRA